MKRNLLLVLALLLLGTVYSQNDPEKKHKGKSYNEQGEIIKTGWNFGPLPVVSYDTDLGFQYGATCDIFYYGDGSRYPRYDFKMNVEASRHTGGSSVLRFYGDFPYLIKNTKLFLDLSYFMAKKYDFFGFNGYLAPSEDPYSGLDMGKSAYHFLNRSQFRFVGSMQRPFFDVKNLYWTAGLAYYNTKIDRIEMEGYEDQITLYERYLAEDIIKEDEANGGNSTQIRLGMVYDSRNHNTIPSRGIYIEGTFTAAPDFIDRRGYDNLSFTLLWRQYVPVFADKLVFAYRIGAQNLLAGKTTWFMMNNLNTLFFHKMYTEGLGGSNTVRGIDRNRVMGPGFAFANFELRWRIVSFQFINQNWMIGLNPFFDAGMVTQKTREEEMSQAEEVVLPDNGILPRLHSGKNEIPHLTFGCGLKIIMNTNFVLSIDFAKALDKRDGDKLKTYIGFNYIF